MVLDCCDCFVCFGDDWLCIDACVLSELVIVFKLTVTVGLVLF